MSLSNRIWLEWSVFFCLCLCLLGYRPLWNAFQTVKEEMRVFQTVIPAPHFHFDAGMLLCFYFTSIIERIFFFFFQILTCCLQMLKDLSYLFLITQSTFHFIFFLNLRWFDWSDQLLPKHDRSWYYGSAGKESQSTDFAYLGRRGSFP